MPLTISLIVTVVDSNLGETQQVQFVLNIGTMLLTPMNMYRRDTRRPISVNQVEETSYLERVSCTDLYCNWSSTDEFGHDALVMMIVIMITIMIVIMMMMVMHQKILSVSLRRLIKRKSIGKYCRPI